MYVYSIMHSTPYSRVFDGSTTSQSMSVNGATSPARGRASARTAPSLLCATQHGAAECNMNP